MRLLTATISAAVVVAAMAAGPSASAASSTQRSQAVTDQANWISRAQLGDGAIATYVDQQHVWPYLANFAALGLAQASAATGDPAYAARAWRWLHWYSAHEDSQGYVTDYDVQGGVPVSNGNIDSTDAYAGTFLLATAAAFEADPDSGKLADVKAGVMGAVGAIESTQDSDGLTWAKPSWHVKYLMDQAETYAGLRSAVTIARALGDPALADRAGHDADRMYDGIQTLWNPSTGAYDWAKHEDGVTIPTDWHVLYPDAMQQAWAVAFGLVPAQRASDVVATLQQAQPDWDKPRASAPYLTDATVADQPVNYWPVAGWALQVAGRPADAAGSAASIVDAASTVANAWPYTTATAGQLVTLETGVLPSHYYQGATSASIQTVVHPRHTIKAHLARRHHRTVRAAPVRRAVRSPWLSRHSLGRRWWPAHPAGEHRHPAQLHRPSQHHQRSQHHRSGPSAPGWVAWSTYLGGGLRRFG